MAVTLESCQGEALVARAGPEHRAHGDPYDMACTVEREGTRATIKGVVAMEGRMTRQVLRELSDALCERGIRTLRIERKRHGRVTEHEWDIS